MTLIIAEIGVNHNGDVNKAKMLVDAAKKAGADVAKFQIFNTDSEIHPDTRQADYQTVNTGQVESMADMCRKLELTFPEFAQMKAHCDKIGIEFMASIFGLEAMNFYVDELGCKTVKFGSGELRNPPLLLSAARKGAKVIISTGMSDLQDIEDALGILAHGYTAAKADKPSEAAFKAAFANKEGQAALKKNVVILQCTTNYPALDEEINLRAMETIAKKFGLPVGFSDHSMGIGNACAAVALGAVVYEKHFTYDHDAPGPDHKASLNPEEMAQCVQEIRRVEKSLGSGEKKIEKSSEEIAKIACRNLVAWADIKKGEKFTEENLWALRTNEMGIDSGKFYDWVGRVADRDYEKLQMIG